MKKIITFFIATLWIYGCKKEASLPEYNTDPVIASYLIPGNTISLQLSHQESTSSTQYSAPGLDSLNITITSNDTIYHLTSNGNGLYTDTSLVITAGNKYSLQFTYNGKVVTASTILPAKPTDYAQSATAIAITQITSSSSSSMGMPGSGPADPVKLTWSNSDNSYYIVVVQNMETNLVPINDTMTIIDSSRIFRNTPTTGSSYNINTRDFTYYGYHRLILFHINADYASLYNNNSSSSQNLSTPSTGITNGVGIFTGINSDTLFLHVDKQ